MADPTPTRDGAGYIADEIKRDRQRAREQEKASGTQRANAVKVLQATVAELQRVVQDLSAVVTAQGQQAQQLQAQQEQLSAQVAFLQGATSYAANGGVTNGVRGASGGISLDGFNPGLDCQVSLTTSSTGKLAINVGANLGGDDGVSAVVGYEVLWAGGSIPIDWTRCAAAGGGLATTSRTSFVTVPANTAVTVRTRRGWQGGQGGLCIWAYQSLQVTKEGL